MISPIEKARILTHEGHAERSKVKGLTVAELRTILACITELEALTDPCPILAFFDAIETPSKCTKACECGGVGRVAKQPDTRDMTFFSDGALIESGEPKEPWVEIGDYQHVSCAVLAGSGSWENNDAEK